MEAQLPSNAPLFSAPCVRHLTKGNFYMLGGQ